MSVISINDEMLRTLAPMRVVIESVKQALAGLEKDEFELPLRTRLGNGQGLLMPLFHQPTNSSVTKVLSLDADRNPFITGTVTWTAKGQSNSLVANAIPVTTIRTGAIVGVAVDLLAMDDVENLVVFGAGAQAADQVRAVLAVRAIKNVSIIDKVESRASAAAGALEGEFADIRFRGVTEPASVVGSADIICCATTSTSALFSERQLSDSVVVTAIGAYRPDMHELPQDLLASGCPIYVDNLQACIAEAGEIVEALKSGTLTADDLIPLGKALVSPQPEAKRSVFKSVGVAVQDWAVMRVVNDALKNRAA